MAAIAGHHPVSADNAKGYHRLQVIDDYQCRTLIQRHHCKLSNSLN